MNELRNYLDIYQKQYSYNNSNEEDNFDIIKLRYFRSEIKSDKDVDSLQIIWLCSL